MTWYKLNESARAPRHNWFSWMIYLYNTFMMSSSNTFTANPAEGFDNPAFQWPGKNRSQPFLQLPRLSKSIDMSVHRISQMIFTNTKLDSLIQKNKRTLSTCWCTMFHATTVWTHSHHPLPVDLWTSLSIGQLRNNLSWSDVFHSQRLELTPKRSCTFSQPKITVVGGDSSPVWHIYCSKKIGSFHPGIRVRITNIEKNTTQKMVSEAYPWRNV